MLWKWCGVRIASTGTQIRGASMWMMITFTVPEENGKKVLTMSLDITIKERKEFRCPDCGRLVTTQDINEECSSGRVWYDFLESVGYYVEGDNLAEENDWYGNDMVLTEEQAKQLADFVSDNQPYNDRNVECLVAMALLHGNKVVINADW